jgi:hypothetical protein
MIGEVEGGKFDRFGKSHKLEEKFQQVGENWYVGDCLGWQLMIYVQ